MSAITRITAAVAAVVAAAVLASCGAVAPEETTSGACTHDLACPYGEECGVAGCEAVASSIYPHIQTASTMFRAYQPGELQWRAAHSDMLINLVLGYVDEIRAVNPDARLFAYMYTRFHNYNDFGNRADAWALDNGYDPEDFYLHYREDVEVPTWEGIVLVEGHPPGVAPGWNPDAGPGDPPASAATRAESRVPGYNAGSREGTQAWKMANINHTGYRRFLMDWARQVLDGSLENQPFSGPPLDGIVFDNAIYYPQFGEGVLEKTDEYYGVPLTGDHPHALGFATLFPEVTEALARHYGRAVDIMPNFGHVLFTNHPDPAAQSTVANVPWIWCEVWVQYTGTSTASGSARTINWEADYQKGMVNVIHQTRGPRRRVLGARDLSSGHYGTDRGKMFTLALYYLIHNRNTWYMYESVPYHDSSMDMSQWAWNTAVEFDIGQPDQVPPGKTDFDGAYPSDEHYVLATGPDPYNGDLTYRVLARRFTNALVLAKMLPAGSVVGDASITTHALDGSYAALQADGTLGATVTEVSIRNNEGLILIPVD